MFSAWGAFVYRHRRIVAALSIVVAILAVPFAGMAQGVLSSGGWLVKGSESAQVADRIAQDFGGGRSSMIVLLRSTDGQPADSDAVQDKVDAALATLPDPEAVDNVITYRSSGNDERFVSTDGTATYAIVLLEVSDEQSIDMVDDIRAAIQPQDGVSYQLTGYGPLAGDANAQSEEDLQTAEIVSFPLAAIILLLVFGSVIAAALPLLVAFMLTIPTTLALIYVVGSTTEMSI